MRLALIVVVAFVLRLAIVFAPIAWTASDTPGYDEPARGLAAGKGSVDAQGKPTAERPPGYPVFLAAIYATASMSPRAVGIAQALLGAATVVLVHALVARRWPRAALPAAALLAIDPIALGVVPYVLREALLLFLVTALLVVLERTHERPLARGLGAGALLAALFLTHQLYVLLGPFLALGALLSRQKIWPFLLAGAIVAASWGAWTWRNLSIGSGQLVLTSYPVPAGELWIGTSPTSEWLHDDPTTGNFELYFRELNRLQAEHPGDIAAVKRELYGRAWANFTNEPLLVIGRIAKINAWYWLEVPGSVRLTTHPRLWVLRIGLIPFQWVRLFWAIIFIIEVRRRRESRAFAFELATWAFAAIAPALLLPLPRYLSPLTGLLDAFAVIGWLAYRQRGLTVSTLVDTPPPQASRPMASSPINES